MKTKVKLRKEDKNKEKRNNVKGFFMFRRDGRKNEQHRQINIRMGKWTEIEHGLNRISSKIEYIPQQRSKITVQIKIDKNAYRNNLSRTIAEKREDWYARAIEGIFKHILIEPEPSYFIEHSVSCADGSILSALINSTSILLERHTVPIMHMIFSVTCTLSRYKKNEYIVDPTEIEEKERNGTVILAAPYVSHKTKISFVEYLHEVPISEHIPLLEHAFKALQPVSEHLISFCK